MPNPLQQASDALIRAIEEKKRNQELFKSLDLAIKEMVLNTKISKNEFLSAIAHIKIDVPQITIPESKVIVNVPEVKLPEIKIPLIKKAPKIPHFKTFC